MTRSFCGSQLSYHGNFTKELQGNYHINDHFHLIPLLNCPFMIGFTNNMVHFHGPKLKYSIIKRLHCPCEIDLFMTIKLSFSPDVNTLEKLFLFYTHKYMYPHKAQSMYFYSNSLNLCGKG